MPTVNAASAVQNGSSWPRLIVARAAQRPVGLLGQTAVVGGATALDLGGVGPGGQPVRRRTRGSFPASAAGADGRGCRSGSGSAGPVPRSGPAPDPRPGPRPGPRLRSSTRRRRRPWSRAGTAQRHRAGRCSTRPRPAACAGARGDPPRPFPARPAIRPADPAVPPGRAAGCGPPPARWAHGLGSVDEQRHGRRARPRQIGPGRPADAGQHQLRPGDRRQRHEHGARGKSILQPLARRHRQPGLPDPARPG